MLPDELNLVRSSFALDFEASGRTRAWSDYSWGSLIRAGIGELIREQRVRCDVLELEPGEASAWIAWSPNPSGGATVLWLHVKRYARRRGIGMGVLAWLVQQCPGNVYAANTSVSGLKLLDAFRGAERSVA